MLCRRVVRATDAARTLFPPIATPSKRPVADLESWHREFGRSYYAKHLSQDDVAEVGTRMDGWNFRRVARFAEGVVRTFVAGLDLKPLEATDPPLPRKEDYLAALECG